MLSGLLALALVAQLPALTPADAKSHIGQQATVCVTVKSARYAENSNGKPTFLNLDKPFPNPSFTVVIFGDNRSKFTPPPEVQFKDKEICVTGKITEFRSAPEIVVKNANQISSRTSHGETDHHDRIVSNYRRRCVGRDD